MTDLHKQYTMEDVERLQWIYKAANAYLQRVHDLPYEAAIEFAEAISEDYYLDWTPEDAVNEDLSYWD